MQIPLVILCDPDLSPGSKEVYGILKSFAWDKGWTNVSVDTIATQTKRKARMVRSYLRELHDAGHIHRVQQKGHGENYQSAVTYLLTDVQDGKVVYRQWDEDRRQPIARQHIAYKVDSSLLELSTYIEEINERPVRAAQGPEWFGSRPPSEDKADPPDVGRAIERSALPISSSQAKPPQAVTAGGPRPKVCVECGQDQDLKDMGNHYRCNRCDAA